MVLDALAGGEPERTVGELVGQVVDAGPLGGGEHPAGDRRPHHARVGELLLGLGQLTATIAIVLLVDAMELQQLQGFGTEGVGLFGEFVTDRAPQVLAGALEIVGGDGGHPDTLGRKPTKSIGFVEKPDKFVALSVLSSVARRAGVPGTRGP